MLGGPYDDGSPLWERRNTGSGGGGGGVSRVIFFIMAIMMLYTLATQMGPPIP